MDETHATGSGNAEVLLPDYILGKRLGLGSSAEVKIAEHTLTGKKVAVKIFDLRKLKDKDAERARREIQIFGALAHPHIIRLYEVIERKFKIYLVMEYMDRGDLYDYITVKGRLQEDEACNIFQQIISGVEYCHLNMVAHRDLKPENLLLDSHHNVKLADFGFSNIMRYGNLLRTSCGSPHYVAPEIISGELYSGPEVDVWSCGVILYAILCGKLPFDEDEDNLKNLCIKIKKGVYDPPSQLSPGAIDLISRILVVDPMKRFTISDIRKHQWFQMQLPHHLAVPAEEIRKRVNMIHLGTVEEVVKLGFNTNYVIESLQKRVRNKATVTYYLLVNKRLCFDYLDYKFQEASEYRTSKLQEGEGTSSMSSSSLHKDSMETSPSLQLLARSNWTVGIPSFWRPPELMAQILVALQRLKVLSKEIGQYNIKCRWLPNFLSGSKTASLDLNCTPSDEFTRVNADGVYLCSRNSVNFEIQLYKSSESRYLLDLKRVSGPPILFLEVCHSFLAQVM